MKIFINLFLFTFCFQVQALTILLDPGHGGNELGAAKRIGKKIVYEKHLTLKLAKMIQEKLSNKHKVYLTRSIDRPVTLAERAAIADKVHADLFISLHFNSSKKRKYHGFETYYLDNHADVAVKKVESIENNEWKESERIVNQILVDLVIEKTVPQSKKLTNYIHSRISQKIGRKHRMKDRGIKPGLFYVLALSKRPNALLEVGFLSNPKEAKKISSKKFLNDYANGVVKGIEDYANSNHTLASVPLF